MIPTNTVVYSWRCSFLRSRYIRTFHGLAVAQLAGSQWNRTVGLWPQAFDFGSLLGVFFWILLL